MTEDPDPRTFTPLDEWASGGSHAPDSDDSETEPEQGARTVRDLLMEQLDPDRVHGVALTSVSGSTYYMVVAMSGRNDGGKVLNLTTVVVDLATSEVRIHGGNSMWVPRDSGVAQALTSILGRATTDLSTGSCDEDPPALQSAVGASVEEVLAEEVDDSGPSGSDGSGEHDHIYPEIEILEDRLLDAGISADRFNNLWFGAKKPYNHDTRRRADVMGNYGVYTTKDDPLVLIDIDHPEHRPDLPETFSVSSPHGDEARSHYYYRVEDLDKLNAEVPEDSEKWNFEPSWGEIRNHNQYVAGPGCVLDANGCDTGDYEYDHPEGCEVCSSREGGRYEIVDNRPIETLPVETLIEWVEEDPQARLPQTRSAASQSTPASRGSEDPPEEPEPESEPEESETDASGAVECHECGRSLSEAEAEMVASTEDREFWQCLGGCP
jgi:hypothetical protein